MDRQKEIEDLQKKIDDLSSQMKGYQEILFSLQQELDKLQDKSPSLSHVEMLQPRSNFRLENFIGLRVIHLVGIVVLVIGLSIGVKYAIDKELISESARIIVAYAAGAVLFALSFKLKSKYQLFSAILFSGAMASVYFTTYAAFVYYGFFSFSVTFLLMAAMTIYTAFESLRYNRQEIAVLGMVGAYGIPFLISANSDRIELFFSYIILINLGVVFLSFRKNWRIMSQLALLVSWTLFIAWGLFRYSEKDFWTGVVLIPSLYILFTVSVMAYRFMKSATITSKEIQQIVLNNLALYLSCLIVFGNGHIGNNLAPITGWVLVCILILSTLTYFFLPSDQVLMETMSVQTIIMLTLFIGFYWSGLIVTLLWVALALAIFVVGIFNHRSWPRLAGILLMCITLAKLVIFDSSKFSTVQKIIAYVVIGALLLVLSFLYQKYRDKLFER